MVLHEFPNLTWLKNEIKSGFAQSNEPENARGWPNVILNTKTKITYRDGIKGPFSLFLNINGNTTVTVDNHRKTIDEDTFFVTNQDQIYDLEINQINKVETFNIHFGEMFTNQVVASLVKTPDYLLENEFQKGLPFCFYNGLYYRDKKFNLLIKEIYLASIEGVNDLREEELLYNLFAYLYQSNKEKKKNFEKLPAIKSTTKKEIEKRLMGAIDYIHTYFKQDISLDQLQNITCLSKFHFLRLFKIAFGYSPYQYIMFLRLQKGLTQLRTTSKTVQEIATEVGLENANSFSRMVYKKTGHYPSFFRK